MGLLLSSTSSRHLQPQQPSSHRLKAELARIHQRKVHLKRLTSSLLLSHLLSHLLFLTLHLRARHGVGFFLKTQNAVSKMFLEEAQVSQLKKTLT